MNSNFLHAKKQLMFGIGKINSQIQLRDALKHNKREILRELDSASQIDPTRTSMNYSLLEVKSSKELMQQVNLAIVLFEKNSGKSIRRDAVVAIEILFSVPATRKDIDLQQYFADCLDWATKEFAPAELLTADVHLDESNPHTHVIFLCVTHKRLVASSVVGYKNKFHDRRENFYRQVAKKHGLEMPPPSLSRTSRTLLANQIIEHFGRSADPITLSQHYPAICDAVRQNPAPFASTLGIAVPSKPQKLRTVAEIFTSKGRGPRWRKHE